jgi:plasmid maintenance system killer protein
MIASLLQLPGSWCQVLSRMLVGKDASGQSGALLAPRLTWSAKNEHPLYPVALHDPLNGELKRHWALTVNGNWRLMPLLPALASAV